MGVKNFGYRLKEFREVRRSQNMDSNMFTQTWMSKKLFMSRQAYLNFETGKILPRIDKLESICDLLDVDSRWLAYGDVKYKPPATDLGLELEITINGVKYLARRVF